MIKLNSLFIDQLKSESISLWEKSVPSHDWSSLRSYSYWEKRRNEKYLDQMVGLFLNHIESYPADDLWEERHQYKIYNFLKPLILGIPFFSGDEKAYMTSEPQMMATLAFIKRYRVHDQSLSFEDVSQALRNFWVGTYLQSIFQIPIECTDSLYAYSMLYPYTDNIMDQPHFNKSEKIRFCNKLTQSIQGQVQTSETPNENRIYELVGLIYNQYPLDTFPNVGEGLLGIHSAQIESLKQQKNDLLPYEMDLLGQTFYKGGTSLLADGLLVKPNLSADEMAFCFAFGAALQLCDDLQDLESDALEGHATLFSQLKDKFVLDSLLMRLNGFLTEIEHQLDQLIPENTPAFKRLIMDNTRLILIYAIAQHKYYFRRDFANSIECFMPIRPKFMKKLTRKLRSRLASSTNLGQEVLRQKAQ